MINIKKCNSVETLIVPREINIGNLRKWEGSEFEEKVAATNMGSLGLFDLVYLNRRLCDEFDLPCDPLIARTEYSNIHDGKYQTGHHCNHIPTITMEVNPQCIGYVQYDEERKILEILPPVNVELDEAYVRLTANYRRCNELAAMLTWHDKCRMNRAYSAQEVYLKLERLRGYDSEGACLADELLQIDWSSLESKIQPILDVSSFVKRGDDLLETFVRCSDMANYSIDWSEVTTERKVYASKGFEVLHRRLVSNIYLRSHFQDDELLSEFMGSWFDVSTSVKELLMKSVNMKTQ